jgi:hypothetical protein
MGAYKYHHLPPIPSLPERASLLTTPTTTTNTNRDLHIAATTTSTPVCVRERDGDVHGRQEQAAVEGQRRGEPGGQGVIKGSGSSRPAREAGEGAEGQVLHHAPLRHHAAVLEGLASSIVNPLARAAVGLQDLCPFGYALRKLHARPEPISCGGSEMRRFFGHPVVDSAYQ